MLDPEKRDYKDRDAEKEVNINLNDADAHAPDEKRQTKVQFPEGLPKAQTMPYPYMRQDSDAFSSRASSIGGTDDEDSEDYDWSDEEDLVDEEAKFEKKMGKKTKREGWGLKRIISLLFTSLIGSLFLSALLVAPGLLVHFYWYKPDPTEHRRFVKDNVQAWLFWAAANILISWYLAMIIDLVPILSRFFISATWGHVSESLKTKIATYDSVKDTAKPAFYAGSAYASWAIIFGGIYDLYNAGDTSQSRAHYTIRTAEVVQFFFFLILVWCIERMLSHFIAFSFHRTAYKERIESVEKALAVIEQLRAYRPKLPTAHHTPHGKPGTRTPVFGMLPGILSEKQHFSMLSGALKNASPPISRAGTDDGHDHDHDHDADVEDHGEGDKDKTLVNSRRREGAGAKSGNRVSWLAGGGTPPDSANEHGVKSKRNDTNSTDGEHGGGISPITPSTVHGHTFARAPLPQASDPVLPSQLNPHRYPPANGTGNGNGTSGRISGTASPKPPGEDGADVALKQVGKAIKNAVLHDARNLSGKNEELMGLSWNVNSAHEAKRLAKSIFMRFKDRGRTWLIPADFYPAFESHTLAEDAFKVFDKDNNGDISRAELKTALIKIYKERRFLSRSMRDVGEALITLNRILLFFAAVILFFISLSIFGVQIGNSLTSVYSIGIAASFIFKNAASGSFDAIMFLFVMHPYDTGDRVFVDQENLVVKKVGLFATVFLRYDGTETYYFNSLLFSKFITNVRRSGKTFENLSMQVAWTTPLTKLDALEKSLNDWLSTEENRWFEPSTNITPQNIVCQRYLECTIGIGHNGNWQDWGLRLARKTAFHAAVQYYCRQLGIVGYGSPMPIVYADPKTMRYHPSSPGLDDVFSPMSAAVDPDAIPNTSRERILKEEAAETEIAAKNMKPTLGFLPPLADRSSQLRKVRRSKHRKANVGAGNT